MLISSKCDIYKIYHTYKKIIIKTYHDKPVCIIFSYQVLCYIKSFKELMFSIKWRIVYQHQLQLTILSQETIPVDLEILEQPKERKKT